MAPDYLILTNERKVRMLFNMNAIEIFTATTGKEVSELEGKTDIATLRTLAHAMAVEGEDADGRKFELTDLEFGRLVSIQNIVQIKEIIERQAGQLEKKSPAPRRRWWKPMHRR